MSTGVKAVLAIVLGIALCAVGLPLLATGVISSASSAGAGTVAMGSATQLNVDALPPHARAWTMWILKAGAICPQITAPFIAAQVEQESGWNPNAVAANPPDRGGDAKGLAQFQDGTWASWGGDADGNGINSPFDPPDALMAQGKLMCDLYAWAARGISEHWLAGDPLDIALAAYFCGRDCVQRAGGVPAAGLAHDYPGQVKARIAKYSLGPVIGPGGWTRPLPVGKYSVGSGYRTPQRPNHYGVDLMAATGTPIYAINAGVILQSECDSAYCDRPGNPDLPGCGYMVTVNHGGGIVSRYCHMVAINTQVSRIGAQVPSGALLGWVGSTGHSSGPHLHFQVHLNAPPAPNSTTVDPEWFMALPAVGCPL